MTDPKITQNKIALWSGIITLLTGCVFIFNFLTAQIATKDDINKLTSELRFQNIEIRISINNIELREIESIVDLNSNQKRKYDALIESNKRLEARRDAIQQN